MNGLDRPPLEQLSVQAWLKEIRGYLSVFRALTEHDATQDWLAWGEQHKWILEGLEEPREVMDALKSGFGRLEPLHQRLRRVGGDSHEAKLHRARINVRLALHNSCWLVTKWAIQDVRFLDPPPETPYEIHVVDGLRRVVDWLIELQTAPPGVPGRFGRR